MKTGNHYSPVLKILLPFAAGTVIAITLLKGIYPIWLASILVFLAAAAWAYRFLTTRPVYGNVKPNSQFLYNARWVHGGVLLIMAIAAGSVNVWLHSLDQSPGFFANSIKPNDYIEARIIVPLQAKGNSFKTIARIMAIGSPSEMKNAEGKFLIYFQKDSMGKLPVYGDVILLKNVINPISPVQVPGEFDIGRYMAYQGIYHEAFLKSGDWISSGINSGNTAWKYIYRIDSDLKKRIGNALPDPEMSGIAEALIIGDETDIPTETIADYSGTGTIHILSVSGLHIGLILFGLNGFFSFLKRIPKGKYVRLVLVLIMIWAYAFLTGFTAPIARSVIMFSIVYTGINLGRRGSIYNSIAVSALVLLLIDPFLIMQASFQLSFIAVTGIVWLQPKIASVLVPDKKFTKYFWELATASIAAQIITLPLSILYFNQFSVYFLPANLIVIPASFVVLISGIIFVFGSLTPFIWLHQLVTIILYACIYSLNLIVKFINHLPGATWQGLYLSLIGVILLYLSILLILTAIFNKNKLLLGSGLFLGIVFFGLREIDIYDHSKKLAVNIISASPGHTIMALKDNTQLFVLSDSSFINDPLLVKFHVNGYAWENYIRPENIICVNSEINHKFSRANMIVQGPLIGFYNKTVLMINSKTHIGPLLAQQVKTDIDAIVLADNPNIVLSELYQKFHFKRVIASSGDNITHIRQWETECIEKNIPFTNLQAAKYINISI